MSFIKKLFGQNQAIQPIEPIFPGESFSILKLTMKEGLAFATINKAYDNYQNKSLFPCHVLVELELIDKNNNGHPVDTEAIKLNKVEDEITEFLKKEHTVHLIGRVTRNGFRDTIYYIDKPKLKQEEVKEFCDSIMKERGINLSIQNDPTWNYVSGFIK